MDQSGENNRPGTENGRWEIQGESLICVLRLLPPHYTIVNCTLLSMMPALMA